MIPQSHTLTLKKLTSTQGSTLSESKAWSTVQTIAGSLQPVSEKELVKYGKREIEADKIFYFQASLLATANKAELKEEAMMSWTDVASVAREAQIVGVVREYAQNTLYPHYVVLLREVK